MKSKIIERIENEAGQLPLLELLSKTLSASDLTSLLLAVYAKRAASINPASLLKQYEQDRFIRPNDTPLQALRQFDWLVQELSAKQFEWVELSPVAPLGACAAVATVHQDKVLTTIRGSEVVADCTNVLAMECALRRKAACAIHPKNTEKIKLCTSHRMVRTQPLPDPRFLGHFKIFSLCTAGRDAGGGLFEMENLFEHIGFYLQLMSAKDSHFGFYDIQVRITLLQGMDTSQIWEIVVNPLVETYPQVEFSLWPDRPSGRNYYREVSFQINAANREGTEFNLVDGGATDWTQKLLGNKKERLFISAIGSELACRHFYEK